MKRGNKLISITLALILICSTWGTFGVFAETSAEANGSESKAAVLSGAEGDTSANKQAEDIAADKSTTAGGADEAPTDVLSDKEQSNMSADKPGAVDAGVNSDASANTADGTNDEDAVANVTDENAADADALTGSAEGEFNIALPDGAFDDLNIGSSEELLETYMKSHAVEKRLMLMERSSRAWNLTGNDLIYFNWVKQLAQQVAAGTRSTTYDTMAGTDILEKTTYTASELGLSKVAAKSGNTLVLTEDAKKKIKALLSPEDWTNVMTAALLDMPYELYWFNRYNSSKCIYRVSWGVDFTTTSLTFKTDPTKTYAEIYLPLIEDYGLKEGTQYKVYVADTEMTGAAAEAIKKARAIVSKHADESDYDKLKSYLDEVCEMTDYDDEASDKIDNSTLENYQIYNSPWQLISVFDGDPATKVVCAGYGKAYKYLCDISSFESNWIECQTMYGNVQRVGAGAAGAHLWCTVRMNNGKNYIVDPTWHDGGYDVFLQGGSYNSTTGACDVSTTLLARPSSKVTLRYTYNSTMKSMFSQDELLIDANDYDPSADSDSNEPIPITSARISGIKSMTYTGKALTGQHPVVEVDGRTLTEGIDFTVDSYKNNVKVGKASFVITGTGQYIGTRTATFKIIPKGTSISKLTRGKKYFKVKWKKQSTKMSKLRVTGYQVQYSTSSTFASGNKTVTVKKYKSTSKTVKKLKAKKRYYVRVRTYLKTGGVTYYSTWSAAKSIVTK